MSIRLSKEQLLSRQDLMVLAEARLREASVLRENGFYAAAIYLAGYAVECLLKAAICKSLAWDHLLGAFKTHDLERLLMYSGFDRQLRSDPDVVESFSRLAQRWSGKERPTDREEPGSIRYKLPTLYEQGKAEEFFKLANDPRAGVIPWLRGRID